MSVQHRIGSVRLSVVLGSILLLLGVVSWRLYTISWQRHAMYAQTAQAQAEGVGNVLLRGNIYLTDGADKEYLVATNRKFPVLMMVPTQFKPADRAVAVASLVAATGVSAELVEKTADSEYSGRKTLMRKLTDEQAAAVERLDIPGISLGYETDRSYPAGTLAADTIGFLGYTQSGRAGQYGVEAAFEAELTGRAEAPQKRWDIVGQFAALFGRDDGTRAPAVPDAPNDIILTLDKNVQAHAQSVLEAVLTKYDAASGTLVVQEPNTGRILAIADSPSFDPNNYGTAPTASFLNGALVPFEPGSSFKPFTMAMGMDAGKISPDSVFNDDGDVIIDGYNIKNFNEQHFGRVTMTRVLEKSINTGVMWVAERVGNKAFLDYVINMGFGQQTGVDLPGESSGNISNLYTGRRINFMTASFGQGITATPIQLISGYSAIANGGKLMRPYVVDAIRDDHGGLKITQPQIMGTPFSAKTASLLRAMLTSVVDNGFDKARIPRYDVAGKTGTAQIASPDGGYLEKQYNHSFIGFAPSSDPKFVIFIRMEKPQGITFAADSLSPAFRDMALFLLNYYSIPPTR